MVYPKVIRSRLMAELPFMASENIMMQAVEKGGNRQELHERLRQHAIAAGKQVKEEGLPNDMVDRIAGDPAFGLTREEIQAGLIPENFVGRAPQQVEEFLANVLQPIFNKYPEGPGSERRPERLIPLRLSIRHKQDPRTGSHAGPGVLALWNVGDQPVQTIQVKKTNRFGWPEAWRRPDTWWNPPLMGVRAG